MSYAYLTLNRYIRLIAPKLSPFVKLEPGESIVEYNPPKLDPKLYFITPVQPVTGDKVEFIVQENPGAPEYIKNQKIQLIQNHLDKGAQQRGYDSILSAVSYAVDQNSPFYAEAVAYAQWRSQVWATGFQILAEVEAGTHPVPTDEELLALLPTLDL
jgi:hypothetical protein